MGRVPVAGERTATLGAEHARELRWQRVGLDGEELLRSGQASAPGHADVSQTCTQTPGGTGTYPRDPPRHPSISLHGTES